ncbi:MAG: glycosyltransferase [Kofleriaceae bacterium]
MTGPLVSAIIPTFNRSADVRIAVGTVVAQTYPAAALEIIVVDDGGTDDTAAVLAAAFGDRVRYLRKPNGGVAAARNHGLAAARGELLALLDDDDEWQPTKIARQVEVLTARPELGMVITDVERMDERRVGFEIFRRREFIPEDGWVLRHVLRNPALAPASAMFRREVFTATGGFDASLRTAEDLDFHLRVALRFPIAVIAEPLTRAMRGHQGLSALARTNRDYLDVIERFVAAHADAIAPVDRDAALFWAYARNARGILWDGRFRDALALAARAAARTRGSDEARELARLGAVLARNAVVRARRAVGGA